MSAGPGQGGYAVLVLDTQDTVGIAVRDLAPGTYRTSQDGWVRVNEHVALGHKIALLAQPEGAPVVRFGMVIGVTRCAVPAGDWVHTHNVRSTYLPTYAHRGGAE